MKRIALMTNRRDPKLGEILIKDLEEVLGGRAEIRGVFFEDLKPKELIEADAVLVTIPSKALEVRTHVAEARRILVMQRTIRAEDAVRISAIPAGTKVLVVNNLPETTMEMVALLQQMEFNHLEFIPFEEGMDLGDIPVAITPGETGRVPESIPKVIDVGHRRIDISTFIELIGRLRITDREVDRRLYRYSENNVNLDMGVNRQYRELFVKNTELDTVINLAHEGILLLNAKGRIALYNQPLAEMLSITKDLTGAALTVFPPEVQEALAQDQSLLEYKGRSLIVTREEIAHFGVLEGTCFNVQEVTYIRQLEQNLSRKLREKGLTARYTFADVKTWSPRMRACLELARRIAKSDFTVLITGESGTGKELIAQSIHNESPRNIQPFVAVNCAAVPENLLESELFGYEGGSFTGALKEGKAGLFEQANNGTVFLDEIGDMPLMLQAKLLRVLQERQVMRVGSQRLISVNVRVLAATNHNLQERIRVGQFRQDLYYRLNALSLVVPPLRERPEDIFPLLRHFLDEQRPGELPFAPEARDALQRYGWPGNIRELGNVANHLSLMADDRVTLNLLPHYLMGAEEAFPREEALLEARCGLERARAVLGVLADFAARGLKAGRKSIEEALRARGQSWTEAEVRTVLGLLAEAELITSKVGRQGSELTLRGQRFLNRSSNGLDI